MLAAVTSKLLWVLLACSACVRPTPYGAGALKVRRPAVSPLPPRSQRLARLAEVFESEAPLTRVAGERCVQGTLHHRVRELVLDPRIADLVIHEAGRSVPNRCRLRVQGASQRCVLTRSWLPGAAKVCVRWDAPEAKQAKPPAT